MDPTSTQPPPRPPRRAPTRRALWVGAIVALLALAGLGALAWQLTHRAPTPGTPGGPGGAGSTGSAGFAGAPGGGSGGSGGGRRAPAVTVGIATAARADLPVVVEALGTVTPAATATVRPLVGGTLQQIMYREGQLVRSGQLLAQIDPRPFELALMQAIGQRQRDEAQLQNAKLQLQRFNTLLGQDSIARQDVDTQAALVRQLEGTLTIDRAAEGTARLNLGYTRVVAPISGRVGLRVVDIGNVVAAGDANGLAVITQLSPIDVEFSLPQDRVPELQNRIAAGGPLVATALDRTRSNALAQGRFLALDNAVDPQTGTVRAKARFDNGQGFLFPSQFVNLRLLLRTIAGATVVPVAALRHANDGDYVWVLDPAARTVAMRRVTRGQALPDVIQIAAGLQPGEQVVTEGGDRLKDGARVTLPGERPASGASAAGGRRSRGGERGRSASAPPP